MYVCLSASSPLHFSASPPASPSSDLPGRSGPEKAVAGCQRRGPRRHRASCGVRHAQASWSLVRVPRSLSVEFRPPCMPTRRRRGRRAPKCSALSAHCAAARSYAPRRCRGELPEKPGVGEKSEVRAGTEGRSRGEGEGKGQEQEGERGEESLRMAANASANTGAPPRTRSRSRSRVRILSRAGGKSESEARSLARVLVTSLGNLHAKPGVQRKPACAVARRFTSTVGTGHWALDTASARALANSPLPLPVGSDTDTVSPRRLRGSLRPKAQGPSSQLYLLSRDLSTARVHVHVHVHVVDTMTLPLYASWARALELGETIHASRACQVNNAVWQGALVDGLLTYSK